MASRSVNKVILIGHLGRDAETAYTASQTAVTKFSVATNRRWKDQQTGEWKEETNWTNVVMWRGENVAPYLTKGKQVFVEGRLQTRSYDDKDGKKVWTTEVVAEDVILLGYHFRGPHFLAVLVVIAAGLQAALHEHLLALGEVRGDVFAPPHHHVGPVGFF